MRTQKKIYASFENGMELKISDRRLLVMVGGMMLVARPVEFVPEK